MNNVWLGLLAAMLTVFVIAMAFVFSIVLLPRIIVAVCRPFITSDAKMVLGALENWARTKPVDAMDEKSFKRPMRDLVEAYTSGGSFADRKVIKGRYEELKAAEHALAEKRTRAETRAECVERAAKMMMGGE